jgi:hypothetical protein
MLCVQAYSWCWGVLVKCCSGVRCSIAVEYWLLPVLHRICGTSGVLFALQHGQLVWGAGGRVWGHLSLVCTCNVRDVQASCIKR